MCLVPAVCLTARTLSRSFHPSLLIPSWEGLSADPEEKRGPCDRHQHRIDGEIRKRLTPTRPNREGTGQSRSVCRGKRGEGPVFGPSIPNELPPIRRYAQLALTIYGIVLSLSEEADREAAGPRD